MGEVSNSQWPYGFPEEMKTANGGGRQHQISRKCTVVPQVFVFCLAPVSDLVRACATFFSFSFWRCGLRLLFSFAFRATGCISKIRTQHQQMETPAPQRQTRSVRRQAAGNRAECVRSNLFRITLFSVFLPPRTVSWRRREERGALCSRGNQHYAQYYGLRKF